MAGGKILSHGRLWGAQNSTLWSRGNIQSQLANYKPMSSIALLKTILSHLGALIVILTASSLPKLSSTLQ